MISNSFNYFPEVINGGKKCKFSEKTYIIREFKQLGDDFETAKTLRSQFSNTYSPMTKINLLVNKYLLV